MGCLGVGMHHAGFEVLLRNDCNPNMLKLAKQISDVPTLLGNLNDDSVLAQACQLAPQAGILTAGVACQPYSRLEMVLAQADSRSATLPGTLRFGFLGRYGVMVLECVVEAKNCSWVQTVLANFSSLTGLPCFPRRAKAPGCVAHSQTQMVVHPCAPSNREYPLESISASDPNSVGSPFDWLIQILQWFWIEESHVGSLRVGSFWCSWFWNKWNSVEWQSSHSTPQLWKPARCLPLRLPQTSVYWKPFEQRWPPWPACEACWTGHVWLVVVSMLPTCSPSRTCTFERDVARIYMGRTQACTLRLGPACITVTIYLDWSTHHATCQPRILIAMPCHPRTSVARAHETVAERTRWSFWVACQAKHDHVSTDGWWREVSNVTHLTGSCWTHSNCCWIVQPWWKCQPFRLCPGACSCQCWTRQRDACSGCTCQHGQAQCCQSFAFVDGRLPSFRCT